MLKRIFRRFNYMHLDEIKPMLAKELETGLLLGYTIAMSQVTNTKQAEQVIANIEEHRDRKLH